jgi:hypothetical protein
MYLPLPDGSSQQPKQSHPFGVSGPQTSWQVCDCVKFNSAQVPLVLGVFAFGSYSHAAPLKGSG